MDEVTQQNAALVEEAAAAAESLQDQASQLAQAVSVFKLDGGTGMRAQPVRRLRSAMPAEQKGRRQTCKSTHKPASPAEEAGGCRRRQRGMGRVLNE